MAAETRGAPSRPVPEDFAQVAPTMTVVKLAKHYRASDAKVKTWLRETGIKTKGGKNAPKVLPDDIEALAEGHCLSSLAKVLGWSDCAVARNLKRYKPALYEALRYRGNAASVVQLSTGMSYGRRPPPPPPKAERPADFEAMCENLTKGELIKHYGRSLKIINRWLDECPERIRDAVQRNRMDACARAGAHGGKAKRVNVDVADKKPPYQPRRHKPTGWRLPMNREVQAVPRSAADEAMRWLQRFGPCYPMRIHLKALDDYCILGRRMSAEAVVAEAKRRGWNPDAWRQVAA